ncbi:DUF885 domain-containing protein [Phenylobacterium sp.]|uniref:DUF885 domain-containing protein n=1 Tax=Phenylobacterium sp. TaxID=1871053 RepID=UPI002D16EFC0|nr:DUF885 domain-containing protein [Phenylobacterium sp.]HVI33643.1 DUF885 domain-containing protein [Phenylobacterium sp.]
MQTPSLTRRALTAAGFALLATPAAAASAADARFARLAARYIDTAARLSPIGATTLGDHRFDTEIDDVSAAGRARRRAAAQELLKAAEAVPVAQLSRDNQVDLALLKNQLRYDLWTDELLQPWAWDPLIYNSAAGGALYGLMAREFAPRPQRLRSAIARMEKLPGLLAQTRAELVPARVPLIHAQTVSRQNPGVISIVETMIANDLSGLTAAEQARFKAAEAGLRAAVAEHQAWIDKTLVPQAKGDFRLGAKLYDQKLAFALMSPMSRAQIRAAGEAALKAARAEMYALSKNILGASAPAGDEQKVIEAALELSYRDHAPRDGVVEMARGSIDQATRFVREKDLITLPDAPVDIIIMPEFQQGVAVAYCDSPGPLERHLKTFYAISPIPKDWSEERAESFLREYNRRMIHDMNVHEAMPGHFVQIWHSNRHPSTLRAVLGSGPFVEGWGVYAEDLMAREGFLADDPLFRLTQLKMRVRSITNAILDQMVHVDGADEAEVMKFLTVTAFQQEREAAGKWTRARVSSAQLPSYFVGVVEHDALRAEAERRAGSGFSLKRYHDQVLSYGSPPVRYARALMFDEPIADA